ncbi:MAG: BON domain-containing protein, partial [Planctomycetota bacterium]
MHTRHWIMLGMAAAVMWPAAAAAGTAEDKAKASQIANEIRDSGKLSNFRVGVKYEEGVAILLGNVTDASQAKAAALVANQVAGVDKVVNKLKFAAPKAAPATTALHTEKASSLLTSSNEDASGILLSMPTSGGKTGVQQTSNKVLAKKLRKPAQEPKLQRVASKPQTRRPNAMPRNAMPQPVAYSQRPQGPPVQAANYGYGGMGPRPAGYNPGGGGATGVGYDNPSMPGYAWPSYAA